MSTNVGAVDFELLLNSNPFNKGIQTAGNTVQKSGIESSLKSIGKAAIAAFSVGAVVNFTKSCLELGSNLAEVQNVVDVTFGNLNSEVDKFAQNAITQFGLGQTVTKKYVGTFGAMAKAFDFNNQAALEMSETLTGLVGDVASFYNLSSDEAFTKLKSVFTGETETLKDLGIVMTQTALDQYAMANGFGKTTSAMTEQEKTALRYQFVLDKLSLAQGDFARTSDSWANQTRVLSLRFDELKATLGQGFINLFTPIVQGINWVLSKLQVLADAFKSFTEFITGKKSDSSEGVGSIATDLTDVTNSADTASDAVSGIGDSAKKTQKQLLGLRGIDEINNLTTSSDDSSSGSSGIGNLGGVDFGNSLSDTMQEANSEMNAFMQKAYELVDLFKQGFSEGFGDFDFSVLSNEINGIKQSLIDIFTAPEVLNAGNNWINTVALNLGKVAGSIASIGITIADNLLGGINLFLEQNKKSLQEHLVRIFDISARRTELIGNISTTIADIFSVFRGDTAKQITADIIAIFTEGFLSAVEIVSRLGNDLLYALTQPFIDNKNLIKDTLEKMLKPISTILGTIKKGIKDTFSTFWDVYDEYISPAIENIKNGFSTMVQTVLTVWNENIVPILQEWATQFDTLWSEHLQPTINAFLGFIGRLIEGLSMLWNNILVPFFSWIYENVVPILIPTIQAIGTVFMNVFGIISDILNGAYQAFSGLIDFIVGVFTGDWNKAWNGIKEIFSGIWTAIKGIVEGVWNSIKSIINGAINSIKNAINSALNTIKSVWTSIWNSIKSFASSIWNGIKSVFSGVGSWFTNIFQQAYNGITRVFSSIGSFFSGVWNSIRNTFSSLGTNIGNAISGAVKSGINGVISLIERTINRAISLINGGINLINKIPGVYVGRISSLSLPRLAEGGYVKANTPQLAMIGDNRHQGEIVAPEGKISSIVADELEKFNKGSGNNREIVSLLKEILKYLRTSESDLTLNVDDIQLAKAVLRGLRKLQSKTDKPIFDFI